mgnify:CR=1 FL=1|jgi:hypothetical protein
MDRGIIRVGTTLDIVAQAAAASGVFSDEAAFTVPATDSDSLYAKLDRYYNLLVERFPQNVGWDGDNFEIQEWDWTSYALDYCWRDKVLGLCLDALPQAERKRISDVARSISEDRPADIILADPIIGVPVPFPQVQRVTYTSFGSNHW